MTTEIFFTQGALVLRNKRSELLIMPEHVRQLIDLNGPKEFSHYFLRTSLINRSARKLFEAWLRKEPHLWPRLFSLVHQDAKPQILQAEAEMQKAEPAQKTAPQAADALEKPKATRAKKAQSTEQPETAAVAATPAKRTKTTKTATTTTKKSVKTTDTSTKTVTTTTTKKPRAKKASV